MVTEPQAGHPIVMIVSGPAGSGKTTLRIGLLPRSAAQP